MRCRRILLSMLVLLGSGLFWFSSANNNSHGRTAFAASPPAMGINLIGLGDTNTDFLFADMIKQGFRIQNAPGQSSTPSLDANGWPQGDFTAFLWDAGFNPPQNKHTGTYALRFNGKARVGTQFGYGSVSPQNDDGTSGVYDASTNTTTATVVYSQPNTMGLEFTQTQRTAGSVTNTGITNIKLMRPTQPGATTSYDYDTTFTTGITNLLAKFSVIRFMDYSATNGNTDVTWSQRQSPVGPSRGKGAWEYAIQLCNETGKDAYINVPTLANDDYVRKLAQLFKYGSDANGNVYTSQQVNPFHRPLNENLHVYIEYSNEVWNGVFAALEQNRNAAINEVNSGNSPLNYDGETGTYQWGWRRVGLRIKQISDIFRSVFGDGAMPPNSNAQVRPLLEWQYGNAQGTAEQPLRFLDNYYNNADGIQHVSNPHPVNYFLWGGGGAAYTGVKNPSASSVDAIYASGFDDSVVNGTVKTDVQWTDVYGLRTVAYEGGLQIGGDYASALQKQANVDPRAKDLQIQTQNLFTQSGGDLLMYFNSTSPNYGLAQPTVFDLSTPKMQAIDQLNQSLVSSDNLALGKSITASSSENGGVGPSYAVDGNASTRWSSLYNDPQWLQIDLGSTRSIGSVKLNWENAYARSYQIQVSNNGTAWTSIYSTNSSNGGTHTLSGLSGSGRYVRIYCTQRATQWGNSLWEVEIYGQ